MVLTINYLVHSRVQYLNTIVNEFVKLDEKYKNKIKINFLSTYHDPRVDDIVKNLIENGINSSHIYENTVNYLDKINTLLYKSESEFVAKIDDDAFVPKYVWEYILDNLNCLDDPDTLLLTPIMTTGIPTVDYFVEQFMDDENKENIKNIFKSVTFTPMWGVDEYPQLNKFTIESKEWDYKKYLDYVFGLKTFYKGIHPVRISEEAQMFINDYVIKHFDFFYENKKCTITKNKIPYLCNNFFVIKKDKYQEIFNDKSLFRDNFDEVPLNLYMEKNKLFIKIINKGFYAHPAYNTVFQHEHITDAFFKFVESNETKN